MPDCYRAQLTCGPFLCEPATGAAADASAPVIQKLSELAAEESGEMQLVPCVGGFLIELTVQAAVDGLATFDAIMPQLQQAGFGFHVQDDGLGENPPSMRYWRPGMRCVFATEISPVDGQPVLVRYQMQRLADLHPADQVALISMYFDPLTPLSDPVDGLRLEQLSSIAERL